MDRSKGIAYCGLACAVCSENANCAGCRNDGCTSRQSCTNLRCCKTKGLAGCWECNDFPCTGNILDKVRIRAFGMFVREHGVETLLDCLERNERAGIVYHYAGKHVGDYDVPMTETAIMNLILNGDSSG
jgi:hypothetical protein